MPTASNTQNATGTLTGIGQAVTLTQQRRPLPSFGLIQMDAPSGVSVVFEASFDGSTWTPVAGKKVNGDQTLDAGTITPTVTTSQLWMVQNLFGRSLRVRCTAYSSGTATVAIFFPSVPPIALLVSGGLRSGNRFILSNLGGVGGIVGVPSSAVQ